MKISSRGQSAAARLWRVALLGASAWALLASSAQATTVTVGSPFTQPFAPTEFHTVGTLINSSLTEGDANATSPISGMIVRWRVLDASGGPFVLRVLHPLGGTTYTAVGTSAPEAPTALTTQTFPASLPIQAGDAIGIENSAKGDKIGTISTLYGAGIYSWEPPLAYNETRAATHVEAEREVAFNADVQPPPTIASVEPPSGSIKGGTSVVIGGTDFTGVSAVTFGSSPAPSFTVLSGDPEKITAIAPPGASLGAVDVSVTTAAGTSAVSAADQFTYIAEASPSCIVPKLNGKKVKAARKALTKADCKLGKVKGHKDKSAKVKKQSPKPGKVLAPGAKVNVKLS